MKTTGLPPSGEQYAIGWGDYRAVITESGAALRSLTVAGRDLIDGFAEEEMASGGRGQLLMPWPNRIRDGRYTFEGVEQQLALTEPSRANASHGLVRWASWSLEEHTATSVSLRYRLAAQTGYPWVLDLQVVYDLSADGLTVTQSATNLSDRRAPYASGAHPYLQVAPGICDDWELTLPAATWVRTDERLLPVEDVSVEGGDFDFRITRPVGATVFNTAFTDLTHDASGRASVVLQDPRTDRGLVLWVDTHHTWLMVYTADDRPETARRSIAVEPMTANADAFRSGRDLITLEPSGEEGDEFVATWGIRSVD